MTLFDVDPVQRDAIISDCGQYHHPAGTDSGATDKASHAHRGNPRGPGGEPSLSRPGGAP